MPCPCNHREYRNDDSAEHRSSTHDYRLRLAHSLKTQSARLWFAALLRRVVEVGRIRELPCRNVPLKVNRDGTETSITFVHDVTVGGRMTTINFLAKNGRAPVSRPCPAVELESAEAIFSLYRRAFSTKDWPHTQAVAPTLRRSAQRASNLVR